MVGDQMSMLDNLPDTHRLRWGRSFNITSDRKENRLDIGFGKGIDIFSRSCFNIHERRRSYR